MNLVWLANKYMDRRESKATDAARHFIRAYDSFVTGNITKRQWGVLYRKYKKRFFSND